MKLATVLLGLLLLANFGCVKKGIVLKTQKDKYSYAVGINIGKRQKNISHELLDPDTVSKGVLDALNDSKPLMTEQEHIDAITVFEEEKARIVKAHREEMRKLNEKNKKEGELFLAEDMKKEGVVTLPSGLQYKVMREGTGRTPNLDDTVITHFRGTLIDGTVVASSTGHGELVPYKVKFGIAGIKEALQLMKEGSRWQLYIPSNLAYGEPGSREFKIPSNSPLLYLLELISIKGKEDK